MLRGQLRKPQHRWRALIPFQHATWPLTCTVPPPSPRLKTESVTSTKTCCHHLQSAIPKGRRRMMNVLGLSLVLTSLAAAGVFSPSPTPDRERQQKQAASTIVKEGHRVVVVEYDQDGHQNTKISISPEQPHHNKDKVSNMLDNAKDKIKEAASVLPNMGQGISQDPQGVAFLHAPKELICDAYARCEHKIADAMGKAKDKISETAHEAIDKQKDMIGAKKEAAREIGDTVADAVGKAKQSAHESVEKAKDTGQTVKEHVVRNASEARDSLRDVKDAVKRFATNLGSMELTTLMGVANLLGFATAYGMCVWVTFFSSYVLSRAMPRQQFCVVQSKIYPVYFRAMAYSIGFALLGHVLGHRKKMFLSKPEIFQAYNLMASLFAVFVNSVYLEPRATKLMFERMKIEKEEGRAREDMRAERSRTEEHQNTADPKESTPTTGVTTASAAEHDAVRSRIIKLNDKLKRLNSHSSILNILNLMSLTWHLVYLVQRVHHTC